MKKSKVYEKYDTLTELCVKWQFNVKYIPTARHAAKENDSFNSIPLLSRP